MQDKVRMIERKVEVHPVKKRITETSAIREVDLTRGEKLGKSQIL